MGIGLSGMVSGLDTDSIVKALMSTQRQKSTKIENKITTNEWKIEKWKDLNSKIYSLYTGTLYKMKTQGNYLTKRTASSNESIVTAKASSIAALGTHTVKVKNTASAQYVTGKELDTKGLSKNSKLSEAGVEVGTIVNITCGDKSERLEVKEDTTIQDFLDACKDAGLNANFDTARNRFYLSSKKSGEDNSFSITTETFGNILDADGNPVLDAEGNPVSGLKVKKELNALLNYSAISDADQKKIDEALEVIRGAGQEKLNEVLTIFNSTEENKKYSADQLNILSAYKTIQNIAQDSVSSDLALNDVEAKIRETIKSKGKTTSYSDISYSEIEYNKMDTDAKATAAAAWKQDKFEAIYGDAFKNVDGIDTEIDYKYIQELKIKVSKIENSSNSELKLTEEEGKVWEIYDTLKSADSTQTKREEFDAAEKKMTEDTAYQTLYKDELNRLIEIEVDYYYKQSEKAQADFENLKKQYKTEAPRTDEKPDDMTNEQWQAKLDAWDTWDEKHTVLTGKLNDLTAQLKNYAGTTTTSGANALENLGISDIAFNANGELQIPSSITTDVANKDEGLEALQEKGMSFVYASNGLVEVDGAEYEADSNTITVNGLTLDLKMAKPNEEVTITITQDTDAVYNMVKDFVKEYNELLEEMNKAYNADSAREYEPLTDEQKDAMSEKEIEKWENKIKDSLLRRDNTLGSLINSMRSCLSGSVEFEGKSYALSSFGICSTNYSEKGKLHIYGDPDDSAGAMYDDKLRAAIEENPDAVMEVLQTLSENLYNTVSDKMKSTSLSSALTVYNDKKMTKEITSYKKELAELEKRLADMEARYYKQFTAMEKALSQMNSSANSLASMLGTGTQ